MSTHSLQAQQLLAALDVPTTALVQKRIPKKMLAESGAATVADRKLVQDHNDRIIYASLVAFAQEDMKRLIAYSSIGHMGFVALGIATWNPVASTRPP